jgi:hypothetical protein
MIICREVNRPRSSLVFIKPENHLLSFYFTLKCHPTTIDSSRKQKGNPMTKKWKKWVNQNLLNLRFIRSRKIMTWKIVILVILELFFTWISFWKYRFEFWRSLNDRNGFCSLDSSVQRRDCFLLRTFRRLENNCLLATEQKTKSLIFKRTLWLHKPS